MTDKEAIGIIKVARAEVEWEYPMEYAAAFDKAIEALEKCDKIEKNIDSCIEQIKWERDIAVAQLKELGYGLGEKPKTGRWIDKSNQSGCGVNFIHIECSECGEPSGLKNTYARYCPWCGAKMEDKE